MAGEPRLNNANREQIDAKLLVWIRAVIGVDSRRFRRVIGVLLLLFGFCFMGVRGVAAARVGVEVAPLSLEKEVAPGEEIEFGVTFTNPLEIVQKIRPKFRDLQVDEEGKIRFMDYSSKRYTVSRWASFPKDIIELAPGEKKTIPVTVKVPMDAVTGGHFGAFFGEARDESLEEARGPFGVTQQVAPGCLVFLSVLGEDVLDTDWAGDLDLRISGFSVGNLFFAHKPVSVNVMFRNRGIFHQNVWGGLFFQEDFFGDSQEVRLKEKKVLPESYAVYSGELAPHSWFGSYKVEAKMLYGRNGEQETSKVQKIWVVNPLALLAITLTGIAAILWVRSRSSGVEKD